MAITDRLMTERQGRRGKLFVAGLLAVFVAALSATACSDDSISSQPEPRYGNPADAMFLVRIDEAEDAFLGQPVQVSVRIDHAFRSIAGFDFCIAYDSLALHLDSVVAGQLSSCGWEYFDVEPREITNAICRGVTPTGLVRVSARVREDSLSPLSDDRCTSGIGSWVTLFTLKYQVTEHRNYNCMYLPIRFLWCECSDNSLWFVDTGGTNRQCVSRCVYDDTLDCTRDVADSAAGLPNILGFQAQCRAENRDVSYSRTVDLGNGGVDLQVDCGFDTRGDINLNGLIADTADAELFAQYFLYGLQVFTIQVAGQVEVSDVNRDGITLGLEDFQYLTRIITGDALPYCKIETDTIAVSVSNDTITVAEQVGAGFVVVEGSHVPVLLAEHMNMEYRFDGSNTRILVWSYELGAVFKGPFLAVEGAIQEFRLATYHGGRVVVTM